MRRGIVIGLTAVLVWCLGAAGPASSATVDNATPACTELIAAAATAMAAPTGAIVRSLTPAPTPTCRRTSRPPSPPSATVIERPKHPSRTPWDAYQPALAGAELQLQLRAMFQTRLTSPAF
jgi:hypothetical protein